MVSNHGGRQLDYSPATLDMIAPIRAAVGHRVPLLMDGGIRRGTDVLKVLLDSTAFLTDFCNPFLFYLQICYHTCCGCLDRQCTYCLAGAQLLCSQDCTCNDGRISRDSYWLVL